MTNVLTWVMCNDFAAMASDYFLVIEGKSAWMILQFEMEKVEQNYRWATSFVHEEHAGIYFSML